MNNWISKSTYKDALCKRQVESVKLQRHFIECNDKIMIILEGRDASGEADAVGIPLGNVRHYGVSRHFGRYLTC